MATRQERIETALINYGKREKTREMVLDLLKKNIFAPKPMTEQEISEIAGCSIGFVSSIKTKLDENIDLTLEDIKEKKRGRKPNLYSKIDAISTMRVASAIENNLPRDFGIDETAWTGPAVQKFLHKECGVDVDLKYVYSFLRVMGFTSKSAARINPKKDDVYALFFATVLFVEICLIAILAGKKIFFLDQCHVQKSYHIRGYAKKGKRARGSHSTELLHSEYSFLTIIGIDGSCFMVCEKGHFNSEKLTHHLDEFLKKHRGEDIILFLDNHSMHWSYDFFGWIQRRSGKYKNGTIESYYLPAYCPNMNPVEYLNNDIKNKLRRSGVETMDELIARAKEIAKEYNKDTDEMKEKIKSYFQAKECKYIIDAYESIINDIEMLKAAGEW